MRLPTDMQILRVIYDHYYNEYAAFGTTESPRATKILVPIDIDLIARKLKVDNDIVFGRLYYHLEQKYGYWKDEDKRTKVVFFSKRIANSGKANQHVINFPLLASVLADMQYQYRQYQVATIVSVVSLAVAIVSIAVSLFK